MVGYLPVVLRILRSGERNSAAMRLKTMNKQKHTTDTRGDEAPFNARNGSASELENLRRRVKAQRRELRRLNKEVSAPKAAYWWGFRKGLDARAESELRGKMNKVFGHEAVWKAEHGTPCPERGEPDAESGPADLTAVVAEVLECLDRHESNVPRTPGWMNDENKCEVSLGVLRRLRRAAGEKS